MMMMIITITTTTAVIMLRTLSGANPSQEDVNPA
jgi:hypothetical protein